MADIVVFILVHGGAGLLPVAVVGLVVDDDDVSVISSATQNGLAAAGGIRVASGSTPPVIGLTAEATPAGATGSVPVAAEGSPIPSGTGQVGSVDGRPGGE